LTAILPRGLGRPRGFSRHLWRISGESSFTVTGPPARPRVHERWLGQASARIRGGATRPQVDQPGCGLPATSWSALNCVVLGSALRIHLLTCGNAGSRVAKTPGWILGERRVIELATASFRGTSQVRPRPPTKSSRRPTVNTLQERSTSVVLVACAPPSPVLRLRPRNGTWPAWVAGSFARPSCWPGSCDAVAVTGEFAGPC
jgi:hypothetical protein